jgi:hypothetical protein
MLWRSVRLAIKFRIVRLVLFQDIVDGSQQHSGNSSHGFLVTAALFQSIVTVDNFGVLVLTLDSGKRTLNKKGFDVNSGATDTSGFLLPGTLVVLRS